MNKKSIIAGLMMGLVFSCFIGIGISYGDSAKEYFNRGNYYSAKGEHYKAIAEFKKTIQLRPHSFEAYTNIGLSYNKLGRYQDAIANFQKAIQINPNDYIAHTSMGVSYHYLGDYQQAVNCHKNAIRVKPDYALAYENLGRDYGWLDKSEEGKKNIQKAKELYQSQGDYTRAREMQDTLNKIAEFEEYGYLKEDRKAEIGRNLRDAKEEIDHIINTDFDGPKTSTSSSLKFKQKTGTGSLEFMKQHEPPVSVDVPVSEGK